MPQTRRKREKRRRNTYVNSYRETMGNQMGSGKKRRTRRHIHRWY